MAKTKSKAEPMLDVVELRGIIIDRALAHFNMLPDAAKRFIDLEDWIHMGLLFVAGDLSRRMKVSYDKAKGASVKTFVYRSVDNFYKNELGHVTNKKRGGAVVSWEDLVGAGTVHHEDKNANKFAGRIDAIRKVQELHRIAPLELTIYLDQHFFKGDFHGRVVTRGRRFESRRKEFQNLAKRVGVTIDDYRTAIEMYQELTWCRR